MNPNRFSVLALMLFSVFAFSFAVNSAGAAPTIVPCAGTGTLTCGFINVTNTNLDVGQNTIITINGISGGAPGVNGYTANWILDGSPATSVIYNTILTNTIAFEIVPSTTLAGNVFVYNGLVSSANFIASNPYSEGTNIYTVNAAITDQPGANSIVTNDIPLLTINLAFSSGNTNPSGDYDEGQTVNMIAYAYNGTPPYTYNFLICPSGGCSTIIANSLVVTSATSNTFAWVSNQVGTGFLFIAHKNDSASTPEFASGVQPFTVDSTPAVTLTPSNNPIDAGQTETYTIAVSGGTGPFTAELYNVSGSAQVGSNVIISSPGGSNTISFPASTTGTFSYNAIVTDLGTFLPYVFNSVSNTIILNPALATPTAPVLSGNNIDYTGNPIGNQNIDANTLVTGGTSPYTYNFITSYASNDVVFSYTPQASNSLSDSTLQTAPPGNYVMNVIVTDSANTPVSANSLYTSNILVSVAPTISSLAASNTTLDAGQVEVYTFNVYNGIGPFTAELYNSTAGKLQGSNVLINSPGGSNTISFITSNTGTFSYEIFATDEGSDAISPYAVSSITNSITVKKTPTITLTATSSTSLTLGGTVTFLASVPSGGAGPFTVTLHGATCVSGVFMNTITTSGSNALLSCDPQSTGSYNIYVSAVDTGTTTHYNLVNSGTVAVAVSSSGGGGGGGGGGSGGGGGGGTQKPVIVNITNGFNVTGIAQLNTFNVTLCGGKFFFTDNFISPNDTGMSVNGKNYTMYVNKPIVLLSTPTQTCYMDLQNVSYLPVLHTVQLMVYVKSNGVVHTVIITEQNFIGVLNGTFAISGNSSDKLNFKPANVTVLISLGVNKTITPNYTIENVTANTPALANATKLVAIRLNISNSTVILFFTMHYPCGMNVSRINAYKLINGAWTSVTSTTNASACADTFTLTGGDPTVGLFEAALPAATSSTTSASTTVSTTSVSGVQLPPAPDYTGTIIAIIVIVVVVVAIVLYYRSVAMKRKRMPGGGSRR